jgi:anaerobic ribonucleoside-triphosphate reductase
MPKLLKYTEVYVLKISKTEKQTIEKLKINKIKISQFVRDAIAEKINRELKELNVKPKTTDCPF